MRTEIRGIVLAAEPRFRERTNLSTNSHIQSRIPPVDALSGRNGGQQLQKTTAVARHACSVSSTQTDGPV